VRRLQGNDRGGRVRLLVSRRAKRRVADALAEVPGIDVLRDRLVPRSGANIDHIAIGPSGVFVIDAYAGQIEVRDVGGLFRTDEQLYVNKRDRTNLADGVLGQVEVVRAASGDALPRCRFRECCASLVVSGDGPRARNV
jgi:Nuclease-related domain